MGFLDLLDKNLIKVPLNAVTKSSVLEELIDMMALGNSIKDRNLALQDVLKREALCSTGLERGIAVPHAKTSAVDKMIMAVGIAPKGIEYEALDGNPSSLFFMILAPPDQSGPHIEVLSDIAKVTKSNAVCRLLLSAADADEVIDLFQD